METENQESTPVDDAQDTLETRVITFSVNDARIAEVAEEFKDVDAYKDLDAAKVAKKALTKMRTTLGEAHKEAKADALAYGRRCDAEKNRLLTLIAEIEDPISEQLEEIKTAAAREEQQRQDKIMEGIEQIQAFALDRHDLTFEQLNERLDTLLGLKVDPDFYAEHTEDAENAKEVSESKLRIAIINEEARLKEEQEKARVEAENKELREKLAKSEAEQAERDRKEREEREAREKVAREEAEAKAAEEREAREKAEAEAEELRKEKEERDRKEAEEAAAKEAAELAAIQAPDKDKLELYAAEINKLIESKPVMQSANGNAILLDTVANLIEIQYTLNERAGDL